MRIVLATGAPDGGVSKHMSDLAGGLVDAGHEVSIALPAVRESWLSDEFTRSGLPVQTLAESLKNPCDVWHFHSHDTFDLPSLRDKVHAALSRRSGVRVLTEHLPRVPKSDPAMTHDPTLPPGRRKPGAYTVKTHL